MEMKLLFPMRSRLYIIPYWVASVIRRKGMKMEELLDFQKARSVLSESDIVDLLCAGKLGKDLMPSRPNKHDNPFGTWWFTDQATTESCTAANTLESKLALEPERFEELKKRLYSEDASNQTDVAISKDDPACGFEVVALRDQAVGVIVYNSIKKVSDARSLEYQLLRDIVKQLYVYEQPTEVAKSFVYGLYLRTLLRRKAVTA